MMTDLNKITADEAKYIKANKLNISDTIRYLDFRGYSRGQIHRTKINGATKRYQHVKNVLDNALVTPRTFE